MTEFEERLAAFTGAGYAVATVNGTAALQVALLLAGLAGRAGGKPPLQRAGGGYG